MIAAIADIQRALAIERHRLQKVELIRCTAVCQRASHNALTRTIAHRPSVDAIVALVADVHDLIRVHDHRHGIAQLACGVAGSPSASHGHTIASTIRPSLDAMIGRVSDIDGFGIVHEYSGRSIELRRSRSGSARSSNHDTSRSTDGARRKAKNSMIGLVTHIEKTNVVHIDAITVSESRRAARVSLKNQ